MMMKTSQEMNNPSPADASKALFSPNMLQLLYARDMFQVKIEGSFSNARAMA